MIKTSNNPILTSLIEGKTLFALATFAIGTLAATNASAQIISDDFSGVTSGTVINGRTPDLADQPGSVYASRGAQTTGLKGNTSTGNPAPSISGSTGQDAEEIALSGGTYTPPADITVSLDLSPGNVGTGSSGNSDTLNDRGVGLGFYSSAVSSAVYAENGYTGLVLDSNGDLSFYSNLTSGNLSGTGVTGSSAVAYTGGTFNSADFYTLTYTVDTSTGDISDISLSGSTADYSSLITASNGLFTTTNTADVALYGSSATVGGSGSYDNLQVTAATTPEPSTYALLLAGVGALGVCLRLRRRSV
jgi:hypothetical protein